ncbi:MAG: thiolase C-terminal domain-containing protein [Halobacteriota archaeon]
MTTFASRDDRSLLELLAIAATRAIDDAGMTPSDVDSVHVGNMAAEAFNERSGLANALTGSLGIMGAAARRIENTSASGASAFLDAVDAVRGGHAETALVVGGEKMSDADSATSTEIISRITHEGEYRHGLTLPAFAGLAADRYLRSYDVDRRTLAQIAVKNHRNGANNPYAQFQKLIDVDDVLDSPLIASPLRLFDCCPRSDGAAAAVITATDDGDVRIAACESAVGTHAVADRPDPLHIESVRQAGDRAYSAAAIDPESIDVACIHDAFSILEWLEMEELGLAATGEAWKHTRDGRTAVDGDLPVNPGGGLKARGHPMGATGISQIVELVWQLRGSVPAERAVDDPRWALAVNVAGFGNNSVCTVLEGGA